MVHLPRIGIISTALILATLMVSQGGHPIAEAQLGKAKSKLVKPPTANEVKQIDARLEKLQETFSIESTAIIEGYERSGQFERAKFLLEVLLKLDPTNEVVKKKIAELDNRVLERTEYDRRFETSSDWTLVGTVHKDNPARVEASGEYKLNLAVTSVGPDGFPSEDLAHDLLAKVPTGALMGMIVTETNRKEKKPPEPFAIKSKYDFIPKDDGDLYLKVNVPPGAKCMGDLKLKLAGVVHTP